MRKILIIIVIFFRDIIAAGQGNHPADTEIRLKDGDLEWMQKIADNWDSVCNKNLKIKAEPLPWIIFYDSTAAYHLQPDKKLLPPHTPLSFRLHFAGHSYSLIQVQHTRELWIPGRKPVPLTSFSLASMPYDNNKKVFFIAPLPSFFHILAPPEEFPNLDLLFLGTNCHELAHTRQLAFVVPQLLDLQEKTGLAESMDDNIIETSFNQNDSYKKLFFEEKNHFWHAVFTNSKDTCLDELQKGLMLAEQRKKRFFTGGFTGFAELDEIFLSLEGSAMWVQYHSMLRNTPANQRSGILPWLLERTATWSQEEGLALFLLIDKLVPDWPSQFFGKGLPSPFVVLGKIVNAQKN